MLHRPAPAILTRRNLLTGAAALVFLKAVEKRVRACQTVATAGAWPGQPGNPVGYTVISPTLAPGDLSTLSSGASPSSPNVYTSLDFNSGTAGAFINLQNIRFVGCRFQSNSTGQSNLGATLQTSSGAANITWSYCSFTPLASFYSSPPGSIWPAAGAGANTTTQSNGVNCVNGSDGMQFGLNLTAGGPFTIDHCDFWGFGNGGPMCYSTTQQIDITNCWIHDPCYAGTYGYHEDGWGYVNGVAAPQNVLFQGNVVAGLGNTNAVALQAGTGYKNIIVSGNYLTGFGYCLAPLAPSASGSSNQITGNVLATDIQWIWGPVYATSIWGSNGNVWSNNKFKVISGTTPAASSGPQWTGGEDGYYVWPSNTINPTDF